MAAILWCGTAVKTRRARIPAWANNILPLLFLHREEGSKEQEEMPGKSIADYVRRTQRINAQLRVSDSKVALDRLSLMLVRR